MGTNQNQAQDHLGLPGKGQIEKGDQPWHQVNLLVYGGFLE